MNTTFPLIALTALAAWSLAGTNAVLDPASPVADAVRSSAGRAATNFIAAAEDMPAAKYGFKPTPAQMSFGEAIAHMAAGNDAYCSSIGGVAAPKRSALAAGASKEELVARLKETFQFCESTLAGVDDSRLHEKVRVLRRADLPGGGHGLGGRGVGRALQPDRGVSPAERAGATDREA